MPKEIIAKSEFQRGEPWLEVAWSRQCYVNVGVRTEDEDKHPEAVRFCDLDRESINKMIRALRKARDQAFGADA